jgi:hypothetical protein
VGDKSGTEAGTGHRSGAKRTHHYIVGRPGPGPGPGPAHLPQNIRQQIFEKLDQMHWAPHAKRKESLDLRTDRREPDVDRDSEPHGLNTRVGPESGTGTAGARTEGCSQDLVGTFLGAHGGDGNWDFTGGGLVLKQYLTRTHTRGCGSHLNHTGMWAITT